MKSIHIVVPDLFLPQALAKEVCAGLSLPSLEKMLARSNAEPLPTRSLEAWLCHAFKVPEMAIAPVTLKADGINAQGAYWLRADPVHLHLNRSQVLLQTNVTLSLLEAQQLCELLNQHFSEAEIRFFAPHPQRWYVRVNDAPELVTHSVYQVEGRDSRLYLPQGKAALKWHGVMNEAQMILHETQYNQDVVNNGKLRPNSIWLWGGGRASDVVSSFDQLYGDSELAEAFALAADIPCSRIVEVKADVGKKLYVWEGMSAALRRGDFYAWRESVLSFEKSVLSPLLHALLKGKIDRIMLEALGEEDSQRFLLTSPLLWKFWRSAQPLASYGRG
jgi:hypothetical protein